MGGYLKEKPEEAKEAAEEIFAKHDENYMPPELSIDPAAI